MPALAAPASRGVFTHRIADQMDHSEELKELLFELSKAGKLRRLSSFENLELGYPRSSLGGDAERTWQDTASGSAKIYRW
jgi:hypothetical protein